MNELIKLITSDQQKQLLSLLINGPDFVSLCTINGDVNYVNGSGCAMVGLERDKKNKLVDTEFLMPFEVDRFNQEVNPTLMKEGKWIGKIVYRNFLTGEPIPVHTTNLLIYDSETALPISRATIARDLRQEELALSQQKKLMTLVNSSKDLMSLLTLSGTNEYINESGRQLLGIDTQEDIRKIHISSLHTEDQLRFVEEELLPSVMQHGQWSGTFSARHYLSGEIIPLENNCIRIDDPHTGQPTAIGAVMRDLRPDLKAQEAIRHSEEKFRKLMMHAPVAMGLLEGAAFRVSAANPHMLFLWGKTDEIIGLPLVKGLPEIEGQGFIEILQKVRESGVSYYGYETHIQLHRQGQLEDAYFNFVYARSEEEADTIIVVATEVTRQIQAKKELEESEQRFRSLILDAPMATALYKGKDLIIEIANPAMLELWGKDESVIGKPLHEALPELVGQPFIPRLLEVMKTGILYHTDQEKAELVVNGELQPFWFNYTYKPLYNGSGIIDRVLNMATDVSSLVRLQKIKDDFIALASHELKTPMTTIKGYAQLLASRLEVEHDSLENKMLFKINQQIDKLNQLIVEMLDVTHIRAGKMLFRPRLFDPGTLTAEIAEDLRSVYQTHAITLNVKENAAVYSDPDKITQVITNLLSNAIKYSPGKTEIIVSVFVEQQYVIVLVRDFGIGVSEEHRTKIFDQFYRVNEGSGGTYPGLGLGLYISSEIIKHAGGKIWMEPAENTGSIFGFKLPVYKGQ